MQTNVSLVKWAFDSPIKSTSLNFNSIFTGDSAPCLIPMLGIWRGSIGIKFIPLCPSEKWMSQKYMNYWITNEQLLELKRITFKLSQKYSLWPKTLTKRFVTRTMHSVSPAWHRSMSWAANVEKKSFQKWTLKFDETFSRIISPNN